MVAKAPAVPAPAPVVKAVTPPAPPEATVVSNAVVEPAPIELPAPPPPKLQAVIYDPQNPSAIVNGKIVHPTDVLGDFRIRAILPSAVLIEYGDGSIRKLNLGE